MINLAKAVLPSCIIVDGNIYKIHTDFQYWINFCLILQKSNKHFLTDFDFLYVEKIPQDRQKGLDELVRFSSPKRTLPKSTGAKTSTRILDYEVDADVIYAAFYEQYHIDLINPSLHLHWYKFNALLEGLKDTKLNDIMGYRSYNENDKSDYKSYMRQMRQAWELDEILTEEEQKALDDFDAKLKC